jgi:hypothetical protein
MSQMQTADACQEKRVRGRRKVALAMTNQMKREKEESAKADTKTGMKYLGGHYRAGIIWLLLAFSRMHVHFLYESFQRFVGLPPSIMECK